MDYVKNAWYVAGWASEFDGELKRVTILEENLVMFRNSSGQVVALEDRCPHRMLPLSKGKLIGDDIQCGYHGLTFNCEGKCVRIPGQNNLPASASVKAYTVHEKHNIVWIWMGEQESANPDEIFTMPEFDDPSWHAHQGEALHLKSHYLNVAENLVDPAHVSFVHPTTLGSVSGEDVPVSVSTEDEVIVAWRWIKNSLPVGFFKEYGGFSGDVDRWHYYYLHLPCTAVIDFGSADSSLALKEDERDKGVRIFALHFITPVTADYSIDRWMHLRNKAVGDDAVSAKMDAMFKVAFNEDKEILEAIQLEEKKLPHRRPLRIAIDKGPMVYRKRIRELVEVEKNREETVT